VNHSVAYNFDCFENLLPPLGVVKIEALESKNAIDVSQAMERIFKVGSGTPNINY